MQWYIPDDFENGATLSKPNADIIIKGAANVGDEAYLSLICYANLYKGLALLQLGTYWEQAPITIGQNATFSPRKDVMTEAAKLFEAGANGSFYCQIWFTLSEEIDFTQAFQAMLAGTYVMLGDCDKAHTAAGKVDLTQKSDFSYDDVARIPSLKCIIPTLTYVSPLMPILVLVEHLHPMMQMADCCFI